MCLNCLPKFEKCLFIIPLRDAVFIISNLKLLLFTPLFILSIVIRDVLGLVKISGVNFGIWFTIVMGFWVVGSILLMVIISRCIQNVDARDICLQVYFWLVVASALNHLIFCVTFLAMCWKTCLITAVLHISALGIYLIVSAYTVLIVNSYRMSVMF